MVAKATAKVAYSWDTMTVEERALALLALYRLQPGELVVEGGVSWYRLETKNLTRLGQELSGLTVGQVKHVNDRLCELGLRFNTTNRGPFFVKPAEEPGAANAAPTDLSSSKTDQPDLDAEHAEAEANLQRLISAAAELRESKRELKQKDDEIARLNERVKTLAAELASARQRMHPFYQELRDAAQALDAN